MLSKERHQTATGPSIIWPARYSVFNGFFVSGLWQVVLGSFLHAAAQSGWQQQVQKAVFAGRIVAEVMTPNPKTVSPEATLSTLIDDLMLRYRVSFLPVVGNGVLLGSITGEIVSTIDRENWSTTKVGDVFLGLEDEHVLSPDAELSHVFEHISHSGRRKFLVVEGKRLVGVLTLADLTRYLGIARLLDVRRPSQ